MLYYHSKPYTEENRVTIGGEYCSDGTLCLVASRTGNKDNFCRKIGRKIVNQRFKSKNCAIKINTEDTSAKTFVIIAQQLASYIAKDPKFKQNIQTYQLK